MSSGGDTTQFALIGQRYRRYQAVIHATLEPSVFANEITACPHCGIVLSRYDFTTDSIGRTVSKCPSCGPRLVACHVGAPLARARPVCVPRLIEKCRDCGERMLWAGNGEHPKRCKPCQKERGRVRDIERYRAGQSSRHRLHA